MVTGSRNARNGVWQHLSAFARAHGISRLAHGNATGVDALARVWALLEGVERQPYPADWQAFGRSAGPRRNAEMLAEERPDVVIAFPGGAGTASCVAIARRMGLVVVSPSDPGWPDLPGRSAAAAGEEDGGSR